MAEESSFPRHSDMLQEQGQTLGDEPGPELAAQGGEMAVAEVAVEKGVGAGGLALVPPQLPQTQGLVSERVERVEVEQADRLEDVRQLPRVESRLALRLDLVDPRGGDDEERELAGTAELA